MRRFRRGDQDAATALYLRYADRLTALAEKKTGADLKVRFDADDVVQSVFRTFFRRVAGGAYDVPEGDELWGLLLVVTLNKVRGLASRHRAQKRAVGASSGGEAAEVVAADDEASLRVLKMTIDEFAQSLDAGHQHILELRVEGYEVAEIAARCGRTKRTVERVLQTLRESLRRQIDD
ncbi:MAG: RNA polymerase sigma factor [Lacipirellulaceae bacterium]